MLNSFDRTDGLEPEAAIIQGSDGNFYGTTAGGGANHSGTVFQLTPSGTLTTLHSFCSQGGTACLDGATPQAGLIQASDRNFYGTTSGGGANHWGTVFQLTPSGTLTTLYSFCNQASCTDGANPLAGVIQASDGNFYGTTYKGGASGEGTVFKLTPSGTLTTLHAFCPAGNTLDCTDGASPLAGVIQGSDGNFYGTTAFSGTNYGGTVFKLTPSGTLTTLHAFCTGITNGVCLDGKWPFAGLIQGRDGNFYGTTVDGGYGGGTVFEITPSGALTSLHWFCSVVNRRKNYCLDGENPVAGLIQGSDLNFYGTTQIGGNGGAKGLNGKGIVFELAPSGTLTTLYSFCGVFDRRTGDCADGAEPPAGVIQGSDGNFYGTTLSGGASGYGTVFEIRRRDTSR